MIKDMKLRKNVEHFGSFYLKLWQKRNQRHNLFGD